MRSFTINAIQFLTDYLFAMQQINLVHPEYLDIQYQLSINIINLMELNEKYVFVILNQLKQEPRLQDLYKLLNLHRKFIIQL